MIEYWTPRFTELPNVVKGQALHISEEKPLYRPYWVVPVLFQIKLPLLPRDTRQVDVAADACRGGARAAPALATQKSMLLPEVREIPRLTARTSREAILEAAVNGLSPFIRRWGKPQGEIGQEYLFYKEVRVFRVVFKNALVAIITLDTLSGEYEVAETRRP